MYIINKKEIFYFTIWAYQPVNPSLMVPHKGHGHDQKAVFNSTGVTLFDQTEP